MKTFFKTLCAIIVLFVLAAIIWLGPKYIALLKPPQIKLKNLSDQTLRNVIVSGRGFKKEFSAVALRSIECFSVQPKGESGCEITFTVDGKQYHKGDLGYIEGMGGYFLNITIQTNLDIQTESGLM